MLDGRPAGTLAAWSRAAKPVREAMRVDERLIDSQGAAAVQQARRLVLLHPFPAAVSTLLRDDSHFEGAITVARSAGDKQRLRDDPFARIFPPTLLAVDAGIVGAVPPPTGPTIERYGSGNPWPWDQFT
jgi:hypothetical protein